MQSVSPIVASGQSMLSLRVAKLAKSFGYAPSVLRVGNELTPFLRRLRNFRVSSLEVLAG